MSSRFWIKTPVVWLDDPRVAALPDSIYRRYVECNLLAKDEETADEATRGFIPPIPLAAWRLHISADVLADDLARLALAELVELRRHPDGGERWFVTHYPTTQRAATDAERKQQERERTAKTGWTAECHESVTNRDTEQEQEKKQKQKPELKLAAATRRGRNGAIAPAAAAADLDPEKCEMLARHGLAWNEKTRQLAGCDWVNDDYIAAHMAAVQRRGEGVGLAITRMLHREEPPSAKGKDAAESPATAWQAWQAWHDDDGRASLATLDATIQRMIADFGRDELAMWDEHMFAEQYQLARQNGRRRIPRELDGVIQR